MGVLYAVTQLTTGQPCALKVLGAEGCFDDELRRRFLAEARNTPSDASDHIVRVFDAGVTEGIPWVLMELLEGATLTQHLAGHGPMAPGELREVFSQLCHGVAAAHGRGVVHRDLKPDNVFLQRARTASGGRSVKVLDFGIAKVLGPARLQRAASVIVGTQGWWAPEQMIAGMISPATDVWALGLLAYWCLTGQRFHDTAERIELRATERALAQGVAGRVPSALDPWFARCLALEPAQRFPDAAAAWRALDAALASPPSATDAPPPPPVGKTFSVDNTLWVLVGVGALMLLGGFALAGFLAPRAESARVNAAPPMAPLSAELQPFFRQWNAQLDAITRGQPPNLAPFYAESVRFRGSRSALRQTPWIERYWTDLYRQGASIQLDVSGAVQGEERLDATRDSHQACVRVSGDTSTVTLVRIRATENNPASDIENRDGSRCTSVRGVYLVRLRRAGGAWRICHETWSLEEGVCPSCPQARDCPSR